MVSVVIPVYNQAHYLPFAVESVLAQSFDDYEVIVIDDGSSDGTPRVIASYGDRIRSIRKKNGGTASALNAGILTSRGHWVAWLSADDSWEVDKLMKEINAAEVDPSIGLVYSDLLRIGADGQVLRREHYPSPTSKKGRLLRLIWDCFINGSTVLVRRDVFDTVGLFDENNPYTQDYEMWFRIVSEYGVRHVSEPLTRYRVHSSQTSADTASMEIWSDRVVAHWIPRLGTVMGAIGAAVYVGTQLRRLPLHLRKSTSGGGIPLRAILRNIGIFWIGLVNTRPEQNSR